MFREARGDETILLRDETIFAFGAELRKRRMVINELTQRRTAPDTGDRQMRVLSFILALAFVLAGPSVAGFQDSGLPGIGTFSYNGSAIVTTSPSMVVAVR